LEFLDDFNESFEIIIIKYEKWLLEFLPYNSIMLKIPLNSVTVVWLHCCTFFLLLPMLYIYLLNKNCNLLANKYYFYYY
jgi:hypothetical protein